MNIRQIEPQAAKASALLKAMSNQRRLMILCHLIAGEKSAGELERLVGLRQSALSQHLAKLRGHNLVRTRRNGQSIHYALAADGPRAVIDVLYRLYCGRKRTAGSNR
ncbi:MAG: helix-turn-helix transcriptional regulator [Alphaproteobacteria bacterium]|nr:helix-turn-helix transcriptional regulator [Alphaproteobacteria bacterium]